MVQRVTAVVREGAAAAFEGGFVEVRQRLFMSAGFRGISVLQGVEEPGSYVVQVLWEDPDELRAFAEDRFERCWAPVQPFLARRPEVEHFVERPNLGLHGPGVVTDLGWVAG